MTEPVESHLNIVLPPLPIDQALPALRDALRARTAAVLQAPPGAGKTTRVPLALLDEPWLHGQKIVMLEPRRLAARAAARRMADTLGERVGETVGYRVRMDTRVGPATRIEVVTEGILTRMLQSDPTLDGVGIVIFDEFHERSLNADLGLALARESQSVLRDDLRLLVMSATLDTAPVATMLDDAPVITSEGRSYPVATRYAERRPDTPLERFVASSVREAVAQEEGDVLVFLPGTGEIRRVAQLLESPALPSHVHVAPLHGTLPQSEQDRALAPSPPGTRKVVLSTSIAETSLTIEGVRVVIDSGLMRVPRFSPTSGMTRLDTVRVSRASADQRRGRAGRIAPGVCYRLWAEHEQHGLLAHRPPEIMEADLAPLALELAVAGIADSAALRWLNPPPSGAFAHARELLTHLGAIGADGRATPHGHRMAALAMHPRLAHMLLTGIDAGHGTLASYIAALLGERDIVYADGAPPDADLRLRVEALQALHDDRSDPVAALGYRLDRTTARKILAEARDWRRQLRVPESSVDLDACGWLLAFAYPDRIAQRRAGSVGRFLLRNGKGVVLHGGQALSTADYIVVADLDGKQPESRIYLAAEVELAMLERYLRSEIVRTSEVIWDPETQSVRARTRETLGALVLADAPVHDPDAALVAEALRNALYRAGADALPWSPAARAVQARVAFLRARDDSWPDFTDDALLRTLDDWLVPHLHGLTRLDDVRRIDMAEILTSALSWQQRSALDQRAPSHYVVPTGSRLAIDYTDPASPVLAVRLQELFGLAETPRIDNGAVPLTMHLLSPAHRPVQVTRDLAGFWRGSYFEVRKEMKGRYPKHEWPDDPLAATPTTRAKRRQS